MCIRDSISIPLRIFDKNQGEKARTEIDIKHAERLRDAAQNQVCLLYTSRCV